MKKRKHDILIIDPAQNEPETAAYNRILLIFGELAEYSDFSLRSIVIKCPALSTEDPLSTAFDEHQFAGVFGLGSSANVTDSPAWLPLMKSLLIENVFNAHIPFLGICFSHQMLANIHDAKVDFVDNRNSLPSGRYQDPRGKQVISPKMALLAATLDDADYFSQSESDVNFCDAVRATFAWTEADWKEAFAEDTNSVQEQSPSDNKQIIQQESRLSKHLQIRQTIKSLWPKEYWSHTWHEQEVKIPLPETWDLHIAMTSPECEVDALVHPRKPIYSLQSHPETPHPTRDGDRLIKNFIYMCHILNMSRASSN